MTAMPALMTDLEQLITEPAEDVAPEPVEEAVDAQLSSDVAAPEVAAPDVAAADVAAADVAAPEVVDPEMAAPEVTETGMVLEPGKTASEQAFGDKPTAPSGQVDGGLYEPDEYQAACEAAGTPDKWDPKYERGHTTAKQWVQPYEGREDMEFELKKGESASQAVRDFIAGPTIGDYQVIGVALEMDELRDELGDQKFDEVFGSTNPETDAQISSAQRLKITAAMYTIPFADQMRAIVAEHDAVDLPEELEAPAALARVEEKPEEQTLTSEPSPEMIADEIGIRREQEFA